MKIRCEQLTFQSLPTRTQAVFGYGPSNRLSDEYLNQDLQVLAVGYWENSLWYYVESGDELLPVPAASFTVVDGQIPDGWVASSSGSGDGYAWYVCPKVFMVPTFEDFHSALLDGQSRAHALFMDVLKGAGA